MLSRKPITISVGSSLTIFTTERPLEMPQKLTVIGYYLDESLLVAPASKSQNIVSYQTDEDVLVRIDAAPSKHNVFPSRVLRGHHDPFNYWHLAIPEGIQLATMRQDDRVTVNRFPVNIDSDTCNMHQAFLTNVSHFGACVISPFRLGTVDEAFKLKFESLIDGRTFAIACIIRYIRMPSPIEQDEHGYLHGVAFSEMDENSQLFIEGLITQPYIAAH
jgi:hypothetical protein